MGFWWRYHEYDRDPHYQMLNKAYENYCLDKNDEKKFVKLYEDPGIPKSLEECFGGNQYLAVHSTMGLRGTHKAFTLIGQSLFKANFVDMRKPQS